MWEHVRHGGVNQKIKTKKMRCPCVDPVATEKYVQTDRRCSRGVGLVRESAFCDISID